MTTYAYTTWFFPIFLVACISSVLFVSIRSVLKPLSQYESHISSDINGNSDSKWKLAPRSRGNSDCSRNLSRSDQRAIPYSHRQSYDPRRYPLLYKNILQQEESAKFGIHSGDGYQHTSQLREHLQRLQIEKLKKREQSQTSDSDENSDPIVLTDVRFAQPQGLHVNLDIKIRIAQTCDGGYQRSCFRSNGICDGGDVHPIKEEEEGEKEIEEGTSFDKSEREEEKDKKCLRTRNVAVVFFLPSGCYIDQQEIEVRTYSNLILPLHSPLTPLTNDMMYNNHEVLFLSYVFFLF